MKIFVGQGKLTVKKVRAINQPGLYGDGNTLYLRVAPGGSKQWVQRLTIHGKRRDIGLGGCSWVTLAEARDAAYANRRLARRGGDPLAVKRQPKVPTFREAAQHTYEALRPRWRSDKVAANWMQKLERHAMPRLGDIPVDRIGREHVLTVLTPIWTTKPETGRKVRQNIRATLKWCQAHGFVQFNAAGRSNRWCFTAHASREGAFQGVALCRDSRGAGNRTDFRSLTGSEAGAQVPDLHGRPLRRGPRRDMDGDTRRCVEDPRRAHEGGR